MDGMYEDEAFPASEESLFSKAVPLPPLDKREVTRWCRPHDISPNPVLFGDGVAMGAQEILWGLVDDRSLLGAMNIVAHDSRDLVYNLLESDEHDWKTTGQISWKIYYNGDWKKVTIDTLLPCTSLIDDEGYPTPAFGYCRNKNIFWVPLLEKAYAKLAGSYSALHKGVTSDAMVDLTGGSATDIILTEIKVNELVQDGQLLDRLQRYLSWNYLMCASFEIGDLYSDPEDSKSNGIVANAPYMIEEIKIVEDLEFVKMRNMWGGDAQWQGDWSTQSKQWALHKDLRKDLIDDEREWKIKEEGGYFWMVWPDLRRHFNHIHVCRIFPESYNQYTVRGTWKDKSAAGDHVEEEEDEESKQNEDWLTGEITQSKEESKVAIPINQLRGFRKKDIDCRWFNNPQYRLTSEELTDCYISLSQDGHYANNNFQLGFILLRKKKDKKGRAWRLNPRKIAGIASDNYFQSSLPQREVNKGNILIEPNFTYLLIVNTKTMGVTASYTLRVITSVDITFAPVNNTYTSTMTGSWEYHKAEYDTAGGALVSKSSKGEIRDNYKWSSNPQYLVTFADPYTKIDSGPHTLAVVVKRIDKIPKNDKGNTISNPLGVVVSKLPLIHVGNPRRKKAGAKKVNALGEVVTSPQSTLKKSESKEEKMSPNNRRPHLNEDDLFAIKRKLTIESGEWLQSSQFHKNDVSATLIKIPAPDWVERGLVITPSLTQYSTEGRFQLEVHADVPVTLEELDQSTFQTISSEWSEGLAGGCHLLDTFKKNPAFRLTVRNAGPVVITLSRPLAAWKKQLKDSVGCMMAFYITKGKKISRDNPGVFVDGKPWSETPFLPTNIVQSPSLFLEPLEDDEYYVIVPATYDSKKIGPFFLTVSSSSEFSFKKLR